MKKFIIVVGVVVIVAVVMLFVFAPKTYRVPSKSMAPSIPVGSNVRVNRSAYNHISPVRFDVVAFHPPDEPESTYIFRVMGLPEETLKIDDKAILINGKPIDIPTGLKYYSLGPINEITMGSTEYFVLGDNSRNARDSRYLGAIDESAIIGRVETIILKPQQKAIK